MEQLQDIPKTLQTRLRAKQVLPFVGAGVSMAVLARDTGQRLFPSWQELLENAANRLIEEKKESYANIVRGLLELNKPEEYFEAARRAREGLGAVWYDFLKGQLGHLREQADDESLDLARQVWELGSRLIITTNYDRVLRWACPQPADLDTWNIEAPAAQLEALRSGVQHPTIWHLHGHIDNATELILTPDSYHRLYPTTDAGIEVRYKAALRILQTKLASHSFLFIGFSMDDAQFGLQLRSLEEIYKGAAGPHYVLVHKAERARVEALNLPVEFITFSDYGAPLLARLRSLSEVANQAALPIEIKDPEQTKDEAPMPRPSYDPRNPPFFVPYRAKGDQVVGREDALQAVRRQLTSGRRTAIGQTAAFQGLGGLGKTQLAVEYAYRYRDEYPNGVIWLNADQDIEAQLTELAEKALWIAPESEHKYKLEVARHRLRTYSECLIIFDNLEDQQTIQDFLPEPQADPHILVTSRTDQPNFEPISLDVLDAELSIKLLLQEARREPEGVAELAATRGIADKLGGLPLALELAGAYLRHRSVSWQQYHILLAQNLKAALPAKFLGGSFTKHEKDLYSTLKINEGVLDEEPRLREILDLLTWSGSAPMGLPLLSTLLNIPDSTELINALGLGTALRLLQKSPDTESYSLHRLVREVRREDIPLATRQEWVNAICQRIGDWFQERRRDFADLPLFEAEIDHLQAWQEHALAYAPEHASRLTWLQGYPPAHRGRYQEAHEWVKKALELLEQMHKNDLALKAHLLRDFGTTYSALGDYKKGLEYYGEALTIRRSLLGEKHFDTITSFDDVGSAYRLLGDYAHGLEYIETALSLRRELLGERHIETATSFNNAAILYGRIGEHKRRLTYAEAALKIRQELLGEKHPETATSFNNVGAAYWAKGDYGQALEYQSKALKIRQELIGNKHPSTIKSISNVGACYGGLGDYARDIEYQEEALSLGLEILGAQHPDIAFVLDNFSLAYMKLGDYKRARNFAEDALKLRRDLLGDRHPDTVFCVIHFAHILMRLGNRTQAFQLLDEFLQTLTNDHQLYDPLRRQRQQLSAGFRQSSSKQGQRKKRKKKRR